MCLQPKQKGRYPGEGGGGWGRGQGGQAARGVSRPERALERAMAAAAAGAESEAAVREARGGKEGAEEAGMERREADDDDVVGVVSQEEGVCVQHVGSVLDDDHAERWLLPRLLTALRRALEAMTGGWGRGRCPRHYVITLPLQREALRVEVPEARTVRDISRQLACQFHLPRCGRCLNPEP